MGNVEIKNHSYYIPILGRHRFGVGFNSGVRSDVYRHTPAIYAPKGFLAPAGLEDGRQILDVAAKIKIPSP